MSSASAQVSMEKPLTLPLLDDEVSCRVPVRMFGTTNFFLLDTGTSATALDIRYRDRLGEPVHESGGHKFYRSPEILIAETLLDVETVFCMDLSILRKVTGEPCDGILGMDFLRLHVVALDFDGQSVSIERRRFR